MSDKRTSYGDPVINHGEYMWRPCVICGVSIIQERFESPVVCCSCLNPRVEDLSKINVFGFSENWSSQKVNISLKSFFINEMNGDENQWRHDVLTSVIRFNIVWRTALKTVIPLIEINGSSPPERFRKIYLFNTSVVKAETTTAS